MCRAGLSSISSTNPTNTFSISISHRDCAWLPVNIELYQHNKFRSPREVSLDREYVRENLIVKETPAGIYDKNGLFQRRKSMVDIPHIILSRRIIDLNTIFYSYENIRFFTALSSYFSSSFCFLSLFVVSVHTVFIYINMHFRYAI